MTLLDVAVTIHLYCAKTVPICAEANCKEELMQCYTDDIFSIEQCIAEYEIDTGLGYICLGKTAVKRKEFGILRKSAVKVRAEAAAKVRMRDAARRLR